MDELTNNVVAKAERAVETVLNNMLPLPRCSQEKVHVRKKREKVKQDLAAKLQMHALGPSQLK